VLDNNTFLAFYTNVTCKSGKVSEEIQKICFPGCEFIILTLFKTISMKYPQLKHWDQILSERKDGKAGVHLEHLLSRTPHKNQEDHKTAKLIKKYRIINSLTQPHLYTADSYVTSKFC